MLLFILHALGLFLLVLAFNARVTDAVVAAIAMRGDLRNMTFLLCFAAVFLATDRLIWARRGEVRLTMEWQLNFGE